SIVSAFEAVGSYSAGTMSRDEFDGIEMNACPSSGSCGGMYTANTMATSFEALGMSLPGSSTLPNISADKQESARRSAMAAMNALKLGRRPRDIITRKSIENAVALVMATGGSTNAVLHYLAIAEEAGVEW